MSNQPLHLDFPSAVERLISQGCEVESSAGDLIMVYAPDGTWYSVPGEQLGEFASADDITSW